MTILLVLLLTLTAACEPERPKYDPPLTHPHPFATEQPFEPSGDYGGGGLLGSPS